MGTSLNLVRIPNSREQPDCWNPDKRYIHPMGVRKNCERCFQPRILFQEELISDSESPVGASAREVVQ